MSESLKAPNIRELSLPSGGAAICPCGTADGWLSGSKNPPIVRPEYP